MKFVYKEERAYSTDQRGDRSLSHVFWKVYLLQDIQVTNLIETFNTEEEAKDFCERANK